MAPAIPDRWIPYQACGAVIEGTRIICFKVPLSAHVQKHVPEIEKIWDIQTVLADIPKLGAVIDLTNTKRYYNPQDFVKANISHRKILMPGRIIPPESSVLDFMNAVDGFLGKDDDSLIGVHCTHGLNRTGYMVCRYMRDRLGIAAQEAITRFEVARGYKIERELYVNSILGKKLTKEVGKNDTEVMPIKKAEVSRKNDFTYKSPLDNDRYSPPVDTRNRFGNRPNHNASNSGEGRNELYSCYTNRYNDRSNQTNTRGDRKRSMSPLSWRRRDDKDEDSSRNRYSKSRRYDRRDRDGGRDRNNRNDRDSKRDKDSNRDRDHDKSPVDRSSSGKNRREDRSRTKNDN